MYINKYSHLLNIPIEQLILNSFHSCCPKHRREEIPKPQKPQNEWVLYIRNESASGNYNGPRKFVQKEIGNKWKNESQEIKIFFNILAEMALEKHKEIYPNYKYKSTKLQKNNESKLRNNEIEILSEITTSKDIIKFEPISFECKWKDCNLLFIDNVSLYNHIGDYITTGAGLKRKPE